jgi:phage baseplate assembly protein V
MTDLLKQQGIADLARLIANLIRIGNVEEVEGNRARVRMGDVLTDWLTRTDASASEDSQHTPLHVGEQVVLVSQGGDLRLGVIIGRLPSNKYPRPTTDPDVFEKRFKDGARFTYERANHHLEVELPEGATADITANGGITLYGDTTINGTLEVSDTIDAGDDITSAGDVSDSKRSMQSMVDRYNAGDSHSNPTIKHSPPME